jgi:CheY-like chemotaxis protein
MSQDSGRGGLSTHPSASPQRMAGGLPSMDRTTVLFVDDDAFIRGAYGDLLRDEGFSVVEAADGCEALQAASAISGDVLLVLDEMMPCMRGTEVLERLARRADANRFRVVIISGSGSDLLHTLPRQGLRIHAVVEKPFTASELLSALHKLAA